MIYLLTDHSGLNKFSGDEDPNFRSVCAKVEKLAKEASSIVQRNYDGRYEKHSNSLYIQYF